MGGVDWAGMWQPQRSPVETVLRGLVVYVFVHAAFRIVGRRELRQHTAYAIVLLFLVGVALRQTIVGSDPSLTTGMIGFGTLLAADALARWLTWASPRAALFINGPVRELVRDGQVNERDMRREHVSREQLLAALRHHGRERLDEVHLATLEPSGHISFVFAEHKPAREPPEG